MAGKTVTARVVVAGLFVWGAVGAVSTQQMTVEEPNRPAIKFQVKNFEGLLKNAVDLGGRQVAEKARQVYPQIALVRSSEPIIKGWAMPEVGFIFEVEVPDILNYGSWMLAARATQQQSRVVPIVPVPVAQSSQGTAPPPGAPPTDKPVSASSAVQAADPLKASPIVGFFDPVTEYRDRVRDALIEALLENSGGLPMKESDWLAVVATNTPMAQQNPLDPDPRKLTLQIRALDLMKYLRKEITKDDARGRIIETRF
jgi:hypothetical protein